MSADGEHPTSRVRRPRRYPRLILRTMRGGLVDPADVPATDVEGESAEDAALRREMREQFGVHTVAGVDERGRPRVTVWMPRSLARHLADLTEDGARMELLDGDVEGARRGMQYARDLRALTELGGEMDLEPPQPGNEQHN
jgi:hypothetical protein